MTVHPPRFTNHAMPAPALKPLAMHVLRLPKRRPWKTESVLILFRLFFLTHVAVVAPISAAVPPDHAQKMKAGLALFRDWVGPVLRENCLECHGGKQVKGEFDLGNREKLLQSESVDLAHPGESGLLKLIRHEEKPEMPKRKPKLAEADIAAIASWLEQRAPYDKPLVEGKPVEELINRCIAGLATRMNRQRHIIIGTGGVFTAADTYRKLRLGASLVQIYTALIYEGPGVIADINQGLCSLLSKDGFRNVSEAVGADLHHA